MKTPTEIADEIVTAWQANPGMAGDPDLRGRIESAIRRERQPRPAVSEECLSQLMTDRLKKYLAAGRELREVATPGPWQTQDGEMGAFAVVTGDRHTQPNKRRLVARVDIHRSRLEEIHCDAIFIADARTRVEVYENALTEAVEALKTISNHIIGKSYRGSDAGHCAAFAYNEACEALARVEQLVPGGCERSEAFPAGSAITEDDLKP